MRGRCAWACHSTSVTFDLYLGNLEKFFTPEAVGGEGALVILWVPGLVMYQLQVLLTVTALLLEFRMNTMYVIGWGRGVNVIKMLYVREM